MIGWHNHKILIAKTAIALKKILLRLVTRFFNKIILFYSKMKLRKILSNVVF